MPWMRFANVLIATGLMFAASACQSQPAAESAAPAEQTRTPVAPSLAKAKLSEATAAAKSWKPDAVLIQVAARNIGDDGMAVMWDYGFWSPSAKTCLVVNVAAGGAADTQESGGEICESPALPQNFINSDQAMKVARSNGLTQPKATMVVSVLEGSGPFWSVMDGSGMNPGDAMGDIDAESGAFQRKTIQQ